MDVLGKARVFAPEFLSQGVDYAMRKGSLYATINAITQGFVRDGWGGMMRTVVRSIQGLFYTALAGAVFRQGTAWPISLTGVPGCSEGWPVRDLIEVPVDRVKHYYCEKEFEVDTLCARYSMIGEYKHGLKLYRRLDDDEKGGGGGRVPRGPYYPYGNALGSLVQPVWCRR